MKKYALLFISYILSSSIVSALPPQIRALLIEAGAGITTVTKRSLSSIRLTPGYKPEKVPEFSPSLNKLPTDVQFLDDDHSLYVYRRANQSHKFKLPEPTVTKENDSSVKVELKKRNKYQPKL
jgi:hypothetical protein